MKQSALVQTSIQGLLSGQDDCVSVDQLLNLLKIAHGDRIRLRHKLVQVFCRILGRKVPSSSTATDRAPKSEDNWIRILAPLLAGHMGIPLPCASNSHDAEAASGYSLEDIASVCEFRVLKNLTSIDTCQCFSNFFLGGG